MITAAYTILRYGNGEVGLTGWGIFWGICFAAYAAGTSTTRIVQNRAIRRADRADQSEHSGDTTAQGEA